LTSAPIASISPAASKPTLVRRDGAMFRIASTRRVALLPAYTQNFLPWSVISRPLAGPVPTVDLVVGYNKADTSPILKLFLSRIDDLIARVSSTRPATKP
jgi:hypothetical protein